MTLCLVHEEPVLLEAQPVPAPATISPLEARNADPWAAFVLPQPLLGAACGLCMPHFCSRMLRALVAPLMAKLRLLCCVPACSFSGRASVPNSLLRAVPGTTTAGCSRSFWLLPTYGGAWQGCLRPSNSWCPSNPMGRRVLLYSRFLWLLQTPLPAVLLCAVKQFMRGA
jgi:hypothetical protein